MRTTVILVLAAALLAGAAQAQTLAPSLRPLGFLIGKWSGGGDVQDIGGRANGVSVITVEANGGVLLRRDHTDLTGKDGKPAGGFDQIMMIYPDASGVRADYSDGQHLIHYSAATVVDGRSVEFASAAQPGAPTFRLRYEAQGPDDLKVIFGMVPPGQAAFQPIATGEVHRVK